MLSYKWQCYRLRFLILGSLEESKLYKGTSVRGRKNNMLASASFRLSCRNYDNPLAETTVGTLALTLVDILCVNNVREWGMAGDSKDFRAHKQHTFHKSERTTNSKVQLMFVLKEVVHRYALANWQSDKILWIFPPQRAYWLNYCSGLFTARHYIQYQFGRRSNHLMKTVTLFSFEDNID